MSALFSHFTGFKLEAYKAEARMLNLHEISSWCLLNGSLLNLTMLKTKAKIFPSFIFKWKSLLLLTII